MSEQNKKLMRRMIEEVWNHENYALVDERVANDFIGHSPPLELHGPEGFKRFFAMLHKGFPDIHFSILDMFAEGDKAVSLWRFEGTHTGEFQSNPATGKHANVTGITIGRFANNKVIEGWTNWDALGLMQQLEIMPVLEAAK